MYPYVGVDIVLMTGSEVFRRLNLFNKTGLNVVTEDGEELFEETTEYQIEELSPKSIYYIIWYESLSNKLVSGILDFDSMIAYMSVFDLGTTLLENVKKITIRVDKKMHEKNVKYSNIV